MIRTERNATDFKQAWLNRLEDDLYEKLAYSEVLKPLYNIKLTDNRNMIPIYTDGLYGDPYLPVGLVPGYGERRVDVIYADYDTATYLIDSEGNLVKAPYDIYSKYQQEIEIPMEGNKSYHNFEYVTEYDVALIKISPRTTHYLLMFYDLDSQKRYAAFTSMLDIKT